MFNQEILNQPSLFPEEQSESKEYLSSQLITYIGNKRSLLSFLNTAIIEVKNRLGKNKISFLDLFSGSGVVSRLARQHCKKIICNDAEKYSYIVNTCYQSNKCDIDLSWLTDQFHILEKLIESNKNEGFISELYAPIDDNDIKNGERVFYKRSNAVYIDTFCEQLKKIDELARPYFLAPLLSQASMYTNTSGVFKGFYKNRQGIGQFGGTGRNALSRILNDIKIELPIFSNFQCDSEVYNEDANKLVLELEEIDLAYFDPPYNQHPYGSNYFILNLICDYIRPKKISKISGIPNDWNRSLYNKPQFASDALFGAIADVNARFVLISYNSEGFITHDEFLDKLNPLGELSVMDTKYNTFRGCRNLMDRDKHVTEFLYLLDKS